LDAVVSEEGSDESQRLNLFESLYLFLLEIEKHYEVHLFLNSRKTIGSYW
jgi:hypothetical protein